MSGFRPQQWNRPLLTSMSVRTPAPGDDGQSDDSSRQQTQETLYYFDAVFKIEHFQDLRHTEHPIQSGSSIVDHSYLTPARVAVEIGMSDAMDQYAQGVYTSDKSKSVSAYTKFLEIQSARMPVTLTTRLKKYSNMLIENVKASDDNSTVTGLRATIFFYELIVGTVTSGTGSNSGNSARPDQTDSTNEGSKQPQPVPTSLQGYIDTINGKN